MVIGGSTEREKGRQTPLEVLFPVTGEEGSSNDVRIGNSPLEGHQALATAEGEKNGRENSGFK